MSGPENRFPEKYVKRGRFKLHSGGKTDRFYDVNSLLTDRKYFNRIIDAVPRADYYVGIATGGAIIASGVALERSQNYAMVKDGELKGDKPRGDWVLIDDVATTENSLREALRIVCSIPRKIFVVVDRRKKKELKLEAMFKV